MQDLRNHGESPHDSRHDYIALAEDLHEFISSQELNSPALIGHSMFVGVVFKGKLVHTDEIRGAKAVMTLALKRPDIVSKIISVDNAPVDAALKSDFGKYVRGMIKVENSRVQNRKEANHILSEYEEVKLMRIEERNSLKRSRICK